jgi:hypothetical protein
MNILSVCGRIPQVYHCGNLLNLCRSEQANADGLTENACSHSSGLLALQTPQPEWLGVAHSSIALPRMLGGGRAERSSFVDHIPHEAGWWSCGAGQRLTD